MANLLACLVEARPDVVALQEIKCADTASPRAEMLGAGYGAVWRGQGAHHGAALLAQGWTDAVGDMHPGEAVWTFWDDKRDAWARDAGLRIDHLLVSPALLPRLIDGGVDRAVHGQPNASDHAPVWIELAD